MNAFQRTYVSLILGTTLGASAASAQPPALVGIGDSLGEGVQSANAFQESQPNAYLNRIAQQMAVPFAQPLLSTSLFASVFSDSGRSRISPDTDPADLAVSGATTENVLTAIAAMGTPS